MKPEELTPEFILSEVKKLQYLYGLKHEIRYGLSREEGDMTESVAEHIYGMHLLAHYFLPFENPAGDWNALRIFSMITMHDLDEIETGDIITYLKTPEMSANELLAVKVLIEKSPDTLKDTIDSHSTEYNESQTIESQFVKAIDAFEPLIQVYNESGKKIISLNKQTSEQSMVTKERHLKSFPIIYKYYQVIHEAMLAEGYFDHHTG